MKNIDSRMVKARASLIQNQPFFGTLALYLKLVEDESVETMGVDGTHLFYAPSFLATLSPKELLGVIAHEVLHCAYEHHLRRQSRDPMGWNEATDFCINRDLLKAGFTLPKGCLVDARYDGMGAEEVFARRQKKQQPQSGGAQQQPQPGQGQPGQSSSPGSQPGATPSPAGDGSKPKPTGGQMGKVMDAAGATDSAKLGEQKAEWDRRVRQAVNIASAKNAGSIPGELNQLIKEVKRPQVDWRDQLRRFIDSRAESDYSWTRPNRRFNGQGFAMPGTSPDSITKIGVVNDSSGSVDVELFTKFVAELQAVLDERVVSEVVVVQCDTRVQSVERYESGDVVKPKIVGRGGTRFSPALEWFEQNEPDVAALIYFTDLECNDWGVEPSCPLIWAAYGYETDLDRLTKRVPFGEIVRVTS